MNAKDLFNIIVKIFGLFIVRDIYNSIPNLIAPILSLSDNFERGMGMTFVMAMTLLFHCVLAFIFLFKTNSVTTRLRLDEGLSTNEFNPHFSKRGVILVSVIILGGYILIDEIPKLSNYLFIYYEQQQAQLNSEYSYLRQIFISSVKIVIALLIIGERKQIIQFIVKDKAIE